MKAINVKSNKKEWIVHLDKSIIPTEVFIRFVEGLRLEYLAQKADFDKDVTQLANEIDNNWWKKNGGNFLKNVKR